MQIIRKSDFKFMAIVVLVTVIATAVAYRMQNAEANASTLASTLPGETALNEPNERG